MRELNVPRKRSAGQLGVLVSWLSLFYSLYPVFDERTMNGLGGIWVSRYAWLHSLSMRVRVDGYLLIAVHV